VETAAPLRFYLHSGSRVPVHCSASGKIFLSQMSTAQRRRLLSNAPLEPYTPKTLTDPEALEKEVQRVRKSGFAIDNEEFLPGLLCIAALVPIGRRRPFEPLHCGAGADHAARCGQGEDAAARVAARRARAEPHRHRRRRRPRAGLIRGPARPFTRFESPPP
jgi:DNA-binding IclR family transcriptional regulator